MTPDPGKDPTDAYLDMMQGSKREQRRWWLNNRFKYMDSKWNGDVSALLTANGLSSGEIEKLRAKCIG